LKCNKLVPLF
nr:RecName: Full=Cytotoxin NN-32 [Naja naja]